MGLDNDDIALMERFFVTERRLSEVVKEQREEYVVALNMAIEPMKVDVKGMKDSLGRGTEKFSQHEQRFIQHNNELAEIKRVCAERCKDRPKNDAVNGVSAWDKPIVKWGVPTGAGTIILTLLSVLTYLISKYMV